MYTSGVLNPNTEWVCVGELVTPLDDETSPAPSLPAPAPRKASAKAAGKNIGSEGAVFYLVSAHCLLYSMPKKETTFLVF